NTTINAKKVKGYTDKSRILYKTYTAADKCVPSTAPEVVKLAKTITGKETNPYIKAQLIYNYIIDNYKLQQEPKTDNDNVLEMISRKSGDAYDFAILYTALLRAAGIPALPESGILVDSNMSSKKHWWSKFYIENFGWLPVDVALGAGLKYTPFIPIKDAKTFYFGNLDSQHITFSNGWNNIKPTIVNSKTIYRPRSYALQSIWEEASINTVSYSSLWNDPTIMGIY
ncbi:MAG: transglutaminase-like domain-containing protein, partial [Treponema sp.]|nr:transglutaminase-like domain-containing protein [Treponema sp.]